LARRAARAAGLLDITPSFEINLLGPACLHTFGQSFRNVLNLVRRDFASPEFLAQTLAQAVANELRAAIAARGRALLVVSGGTTPRRFLTLLSQQDLVWKSVTVTLADERWVAPADPRSNERLVRETLLRDAASAATFTPLYAAAPTVEAGCAKAAARIVELKMPFDAVVLGMGTDGHCASLFPGGDRLDEALDPDSPGLVLPMRAPAAPEPRITLTLAALIDTRALYLHIEGSAKKRTLDASIANETPDAEAPIRAVLRHARITPVVFWCV
jgi:6-phosphogluconolactonase